MAKTLRFFTIYHNPEAGIRAGQEPELGGKIYHAYAGAAAAAEAVLRRHFTEVDPVYALRASGIPPLGIMTRRSFNLFAPGTDKVETRRSSVDFIGARVVERWEYRCLKTEVALQTVVVEGKTYQRQDTSTVVLTEWAPVMSDFGGLFATRHDLEIEEHEYEWADDGPAEESAV